LVDGEETFVDDEEVFVDVGTEFVDYVELPSVDYTEMVVEWGTISHYD
jgi:hypothetical protein